MADLYEFLSEVSRAVRNAARLCVPAFVALTAVLAAGGCATTSVYAEITLPPRCRALQERQVVVVLPFEGPLGREAAAAVSSSVSAAGFHTLVDRDNDKAAARELERTLASGSEMGLPGSAASGATVIISGDTSDGAYTSERERRTTKICEAFNERGECVRERNIHHYDQWEKCTSSVSGRVSRVSDSVVLFERQFSGWADRYDSEEGDWPSRHRTELCSRAFDAALDELSKHITPFRTTVRLVFRKIPKSPSTGSAVEFVRASMFDRASVLFDAAVSDPGLDDESVAWARYNIAVIRWAQNDFSTCVAQAEKAMEVLGPHSDISEVRERCAEYVGR